MAIFIPLVTKFDAKGLEGAQRALANFQNFAVDVGRVAAAALTAVGVASVREAAQFETTFAKIQGLVGLTTDEIAELQEAARRLGPQFGRSGNEAGEALFFITSSGLRGADAVNVLEASLKGAAIGMGDMASIANAATAAMNTYGPSVVSGTDAVDALAEAVRLGQFAPEELAASLGRVIPIAAEMGVTLQETLGFIAALTRGGLNASEAVTGVRAAMNAFLKPTAEANRLMEQYGLSASEVSDSIEQDGFLATMVRLREVFAGNEEDFLKLIGSQEGLNAVLSLTGANLAVNTDIIAQMTDGVGVLDDAMSVVADTAQFKFDVAMATAKDSLIDIGGAILDDLLPHLDSFQNWVANNGDAIETAFINIFGAVADFAESEAMANIATAFAEIWPDIEETVTQLGELAGTLVPIVLDAVESVLPSIRNMASIIDDIGFFTDEALKSFEAFGQETPTIAGYFISLLNPFDLVNRALERIARAINDIRTAFERLQNSGFDIGVPARDVPLRGRRAGGGPVAGGGSYLVGEMGPEIFTPAAGGGSITPNNQIGGATYNITVNAGMGTNGAALGAQIVSAIKKFERTSGPVFASA